MLKQLQGYATLLFQVTKQQQRSRQSCLLTMRLKRDSCLWRNFQLWKERTCKQALYQQAILKALKYERCRVLKHTFSSLLEFKKQCQNKQEFHLFAKQKMQNVHLKLMLKEWLKQSHILCDKRVRVVLLRQSHEQRMLAMAFDKLRSFTEYNWHLRSQVMQGFHKHLYAKKMDKASSWHKNQLVGMSLNQWYKVVKRTQILKAGIMKLQFRSLSRMYHKWRSFFSHQTALSTRTKVLSSHYRSKVLNRHWAHWQARAESAQYEHQFLLFKSFKKWSKYAKGNALWRSKEQVATQTILQSLQKRIIWAWHSLVRELAIRREEHQQQRFLHREAMGMATRTERRLKMELLYLATKAWRNRVHLTNSMAALINKHNLALKQDVWTGWVLLVDRSSKEMELKWRWLFAMLKNHFSMWQKATKEQLQEVANQGIQAAKFLNWKHVKKTWVQWRSQSESGKERAKVLQECTHLIQSGLFWDTVREILHVWSDYALERNRQRERSWAAEASYKRRKLADYFSAWHHYTLASTESAFTLQGSIQIYHQAKSSKSSMQEPPYRSIDGDKTEYRFQNTFVGIPNYTPHFGKSSALATASQKVIIEEVSQSSDQSGTILFPLSSAPDQDSEQRRIGLALDPLRQGHMIESNAMNACFFESLDNQDARTWNGASHSAHQLCLESNRMDEVVANDGCWPYELPKTGVAWIRYSVKQHNPLQQSWQK
ncbi:hypothetical protein O6H91_07G037700 [Diphasiastrum complanatum]|uniref:Uncharacterized protein n=1 Tax=Diphasiastrum complanatum TaxID=34168 RepID=A0ACC2D425_DIPCM|nr:hypothetical protein O6H91_07G037700 [Diphasiastrum complanatum]